MRVLARNGSRFLVSTDAGDEIYDLARDELETLQPPATRESVIRFDPSWQAPVDDRKLRAAVRAAVAKHGRT